MIEWSQALLEWLEENELATEFLILFGKTELFTPDMQKRYHEWLETEEGKKYLPGGEKYDKVKDQFAKSLVEIVVM